MGESAASAIEADVAIVGAGPAGIAAAVHASGAGRRVVVLDAAPRPGGQIWRHQSRESLPGVAREWLDRLDRSGAVTFMSTGVVDAGPGLRLGAEHQGRPIVVHAGSLVIATGAQERFLPFPGWTLPGVMGVGGAQALVKAGMEVGGRRVAVAGTGPLLLPVAAALRRAGADLRLVAEQATAARVLGFAASLWRTPRRLAQAVAYRAAFAGVRYRWGTWVVRVDAAEGELHATYTDGRSTWAEPVDLLCAASGLVPSTELARLLGCAVVDGGVAVDRLQLTSVPNVYAAGEPTGNTGVDAALVEGAIAGLAAAGRGDEAGAYIPARDRHRDFSLRTVSAFRLREELRRRVGPDTIVCRCEDVPYSALRPSWGARQAKLATRAGMGSCQARVCGPAMQYLFGSAADSVRVPLLPTPLGVLADLSESGNDSQGADR
jgi:NADPH-dependent 2,4-dienoyl-CoA reductase/sulfur reductase-like enzyme